MTITTHSKTLWNGVFFSRKIYYTQENVTPSLSNIDPLVTRIC